MNRELLRVSMNARQVIQACEDWARSRARVDGAAAEIKFGSPSPVTAVVIFTKKRERKPKIKVGMFMGNAGDPRPDEPNPSFVDALVANAEKQFKTP